MATDGEPLLGEGEFELWPDTTLSEMEPDGYCKLALKFISEATKKGKRSNLAQ